MALIAIIDDDPDIVETVETILESKGYDVISARNAADGEKIVVKNSPDLVILDVMMEEPDDGFFLAQKLRRMNFKRPIVLLSSVSKTIGFDYEKSEIVPVDMFLEKPISPEKLLSAVKEVLEKGGENDDN